MAQHRGEILGQAQLGVAEATIYAPAASRRATGKLLLCNTTGGAVTVTVYARLDGAAAGAATAIVSGKSIPANDVLEVSGLTLANPDVLSGLAGSAASITATFTGVELNTA